MDDEHVPEYVIRARRDIERHGATSENLAGIAACEGYAAYTDDELGRVERRGWLCVLAREAGQDEQELAAMFDSSLQQMVEIVMNSMPGHATPGSAEKQPSRNLQSNTHDRSGLIRVLTMNELLSTAEEEVPFLLEHVIPAVGITTLVGASGSGKTHFDRGLLHGLASGSAEMGGLKLPGAPLRILLVIEWSRRLLATTLLKYWGPEGANLPIDIVPAKIGLAAWPTAARMVDDLVRRQRAEKYDLHMIDTLRTFGHLRDENDNAELARVMTEFLRLADEDLPVRLSHHTAKAAGENTPPQKACAGAHAIPSLSTQTVGLWRTGTRTSLWSAGDAIESKHSMRWDEDAGLFLPTVAKGASSDAGRERAEQLALEAVRALDAAAPGAWHTKTAIEEAAPGRRVRHEVLVTAIERLADDGQLEVNDEARYPRYRIAQEGGPA